ncbi:MAG TPA: EAL domain-containing protein [Thermoanaerobaculia bacterium]|jgi:diguanylate cyclase (GGDEF)-like protein/PAS domain S-box-containing protein
MPAEIVISAALVVLAIAFSAALVAVCVVVGSAFVSITFALTGREPRLLRMPERRPLREDRHEPEAAPLERDRRESDLATDIMSNAAEGIVVYDRELRCQVWNRFMEELTGLRAEEVLGKRAADFFPVVGEQPIEDVLSRVLRGETVSLSETSYMVPGSDRQGWITASYRPQYDTKGNVTGIIGRVLDLTERKHTEQQMEYQSYHDSLTGLANRRLFQEHLTLAIALAQRKRRPVAVLFLDLDHFKVVNDSLGHTMGDTLLREIATRLRTSVREGDVVARVGGDEFTIVLQELEKKEDAAAMAQRVLRIVAEPIDVDGQRLYITTSIGITVYPDDGEDAETLLKNADSAMYRAKAVGRNTYEMSTQELSRSMQERLTLESGLHQAMERNEFEVYYQPQIDIRSMRIVGMEALLRWRHPERGLMSPGSFLSVAEERGFIVLIGDWVLRTALNQARAFREMGFHDFRVAVNLSARQFRELSLVDSIESAVKQSKLDPSCLELEITETVAMENIDLTFKVLERLRRTGITIAIDDFGMGHSSLSYLKRFPIDCLKIDRNFVEDLPDRFEDAAIVRSVIELAQGLNLRVVAEGVETKPQLDFLREHGCKEVQGFYFGFPVPAPQFQETLAQSKIGNERSH